MTQVSKKLQSVYLIIKFIFNTEILGKMLLNSMDINFLFQILTLLQIAQSLFQEVLIKISKFGIWSMVTAKNPFLHIHNLLLQSVFSKILIMPFLEVKMDT